MAQNEEVRELASRPIRQLQTLAATYEISTHGRGKWELARLIVDAEKRRKGIERADAREAKKKASKKGEKDFEEIQSNK